MVQFIDYGVVFQSVPWYINAPGIYSVDVSSYVAIQHTAGNPVANLTILTGDYWTNANVGQIDSRANPTSANRPHLTLVYSMTAPQARIAGGDQVVSQAQWNNQPISIDGSASSRPDGSTNGLTYRWSLAVAAPGSSLGIGTALGSSAVFLFNPDVPGDYEVQLTVTDPNTQEQTSAQVHRTMGLMPHPRLEMTPQLLNEIKALKATNDLRWQGFINYEQLAITAWSQGQAANGGYAYMPGNTWCNMDNCLPLSFMVEYLVNGDAPTFATIWQWAASAIYKNGTDSSGGFTNILDMYGGDTHVAGYVGGSTVAGIAMIYDWLYPQLSVAQRQDLITWINAAATWEHVTNTGYSNAYHRNDAGNITYALAAAAYATAGDTSPSNPMAPTLMSWFNYRWDQTLKAASDMGTGMGEGNMYTEAGTAYHWIHAANTVYTATGQNLFVTHPFFRDRMLYNAFASYPGIVAGPGAPAGGNWPGPYIEYPPSYGDGQLGYAWAQDENRVNGMILCKMFPNTPECNAWDSVYRQPAIENSYPTAINNYYNNVWLTLLNFTPPPTGVTTPSALSYFDQTSGRIYIRSDWGPDATWISIWAGPIFDLHQHLKVGAYVIFKDRQLLPDTGNYDISYGGGHNFSYYHRTVSSNGILIGNPKEIFQNFVSGEGCDANGNGYQIPAPDNSGLTCLANDGGQRTMTPFGITTDDSDTYQKYKNIFDTGKIVSFNDSGAAVTVVADITNAYNSPQYTTPGNIAKVNRVWRNWVYLRGADTIVVGDVVESTDPSFKKKVLLHALDRIDVGGNIQPVSPGEEIHTNVNDARIVVDNNDIGQEGQTTWDGRAGYGSLLVHTVFPKAFQYRLVGGRTASATPHGPVYGTGGTDPGHLHTHIKDFWVQDFSEGVIPNHKSFNWMPLYPTEENTTATNSTYIGGFGRYRLEIEPTLASTTDYFLNVEKPSSNPNETLPPMTAIETPTTFGVAFTMNGQPYSVAFAKGTLAPPVVGGITVNLPVLDLSSIDGKTFHTSDELDFSYAASNVSFDWTFQAADAPPASSLGAATAGFAAQATTPAPKLNLGQYQLSPGKYGLTVTVTNGSQSQTASATITLISADLSSIKVAPNPWRSDKYPGIPITFSQLSAGSTIKIFTISGHEVRKLSGGPSVAWDLKNDSGDKVGSGIYIYLMTDPQGNKVKGKLAIIK